MQYKYHGKIYKPAFKSMIKPLKTWIVKKLGGYTQFEYTEQIRLHKIDKKESYDRGYSEGNKRKQRTPGWLKQEVHRKLDLMFKHDNASDRARYRWLDKHSLTTSHMSKMSYEELVQTNKMLDEVLKGEIALE